MGLREAKAKKTRKRILSKRGIATIRTQWLRADHHGSDCGSRQVSPSTLYRYFLTKDLILLDPLVGSRPHRILFPPCGEPPGGGGTRQSNLGMGQVGQRNAEEILRVRSLIDQNIIATCKSVGSYFPIGAGFERTFGGETPSA